MAASSRWSAPARWSPTRARSARRWAGPTSARARFDKAAEEFAAVVERYPVNDYAHFCLGRSLEKTGRTARGPPPRRTGRPHAPGPQGLPGPRGEAADGRLAPASDGPRDRHHGLGHEPEHAVNPALVRIRHRDVRMHPDVAASACSRSARCASGGSTRAASRGQDRLPRGGPAPALEAGRRRCDARLDRVAARIVAGHDDAPLRVGEPAHGQRVDRRQIRIHLVDGRHSGRVRGRAGTGAAGE